MLSRAAHPAGLGPSAAEAGRVAVAGRAPAGAAIAIATMRAATATGTSHRSGTRRRRRCRDIGPTPIPDPDTTRIRCQSTNKQHRATPPRAWLDPWPAEERDSSCLPRRQVPVWFARLTVGNGTRRPSPAARFRLARCMLPWRMVGVTSSIVNPIEASSTRSPCSDSSPRTHQRPPHPGGGSLEPERSPRPAMCWCGGQVRCRPRWRAVRAGAVWRGLAGCWGSPPEGGWWVCCRVPNQPRRAGGVGARPL